jgi:hypothetical protein
MLKMCVSGRYSLLTLCNFVFIKRPTQAPRTVNYVLLTIRLTTFCATQLSHVVN